MPEPARTPLAMVFSEFPWQFKPEHATLPDAVLCRDHAEYMATGGRGMTGDQLAGLDGFYDRLNRENLVLEYHPDRPGGFSYRSRLGPDGDLIIRENEATNLTANARLIWRFPPRRPQRAQRADAPDELT